MLCIIFAECSLLTLERLMPRTASKIFFFFVVGLWLFFFLISIVFGYKK